MHVLVVGAGPTGLTLARALHQRGISVRQIDAAMQSAPTSRAFGIQARTLEVLDRFRLAESVLAAAHTIDGVSLHVSSGRPALVDFQRVHPRFPPIVLLAQTQTERFLTECDRQPERGVTFGGLDGRAALLSHADGREERVEADWIVGCDGAHSAVRKAIAAAFPGDQFPVHAVLADGVCEGLDRRRIHLFPGPRRMLAWFPLPAPAGKALWRAAANLLAVSPLLSRRVTRALAGLDYPPLPD